MRNAKRSQKIPVFIRENRLNSFRRTEPVSVILQIARTPSLPAALRSLARLPSPKLSSCRSFSRPPVFDGGWNWPHRERSVVDSQRSDSATSGSARVSSPRHFEKLSLVLWPQGTAQCGKRYDRLRQELFHRLGLLHSAIVDADTTALLTYGHQEGVAVGFSPKTPRPTFLCADPLQRRPMWSDSGNGTQSGQRLSHHRSFKLLKRNVGQTTLFYCQHPNPTSIGRSLLRQKDHRSIDQERIGYAVSAKMTRPLRNTMIASLSAICPRLGSSCVHLYAFSLAKGASLCGRAQSCGFGARIYSATAFYLQAVHLPSSAGHQFGADPGGGLAFLLRPGIPGAFAARVQGLLYDGQDSDPQLLGQCRLHGDSSVVLRLGPGIPIPVLARRSTQLEHRHPAARALVVACGVGQTGQSQRFGAAGQVSTPEDLFLKIQQGTEKVRPIV